MQSPLLTPSLPFLFLPPMARFAQKVSQRRRREGGGRRRVSMQFAAPSSSPPSASAFRKFEPPSVPLSLSSVRQPSPVFCEKRKEGKQICIISRSRHRRRRRLLILHFPHPSRSVLVDWAFPPPLSFSAQDDDCHQSCASESKKRRRKNNGHYTLCEGGGGMMAEKHAHATLYTFVAFQNKCTWTIGHLCRKPSITSHLHPLSIQCHFFSQHFSSSPPSHGSSSRPPSFLLPPLLANS